MKRCGFFSTLLLLLSVFLFSASSISAQYQPYSPKEMEAEMNEFISAGAAGYLMWQYSGDLGGGLHFANDKYSIFRTDSNWDEYCAAFGNVSGGFVGVNMWDAGNYDVERLVDHFGTLKSCGVSVIRVFANEGGEVGVDKVLSAAGSTGVQIIFALSNAVTGDPDHGVPANPNKDWYTSGYYQYKQYAVALSARIAGNSALYGVELLNEPHCNDDSSAVVAYSNFVNDVGSAIRAAGVVNVGIGQMASQAGSACDGVDTGGFEASNSKTGITMTSGHYYTADEKAMVMQALQISKTLGKPFYIGEANFGDLEDEEGDEKYTRFVYPIFSSGGYSNSQSEKDQILQKLEEHYTVSSVESADYGIDPEQINPGVLQQFFTYGACQNGYCTFQPGGQFILENTSHESVADREKGIASFFGVLRSEENVIDRFNKENRGGRSFRNRFESLEQWFGALNPFGDDETYVDKTPDPLRKVHSGAFYKLATRQMQCVAAADVAWSSWNLCNEWEATHDSGEKCPLDRQIGGTDKSTLEVASEMIIALNEKARFVVDEEQPYQLRGYCDSFFDQDEEFKKLDEALIRVDLNMDIAYRPAFLVLVTPSDAPEGQPDPAPKRQILSDWNFAQESRGKRYEVSFLVYHVPATLTEKVARPTSERTNDTEAPGDNTYPFSWSHKDSIQLTTDILASQEFQDDFEEKRQAEWQRYFQAKERLKSQNLPAEVKKVLINCKERECQLTGGTDASDNPLLVALIEFINIHIVKGTYSTSIAKEAETGETIGSSTQALGSSKKLEIAANPTGQAKADFEVQVSYGKDGKAPLAGADDTPLSTRIFNVYPFGGEDEGKSTQYVAAVFNEFFTLEQQEKMKESGDYPSEFQTFFKSDFNRPPGNYDDQKSVNAPSGVVTQLVKVTFENLSEFFTAQFSWMGQVFSYTTRGLVQNIFREDTGALDCARGAKDTEDYLLRCGGDSASTKNAVESQMDADRSSLAAGCFYKDQTTTIPTTEDFQKLVCALSDEYNIPGFIIRGIFAIEGGQARDAYVQGRFGEEVPCRISSTGDVGPMQINVPACRPGASDSETANEGDLCSFDGALDRSAQILRQKVAHAAQVYSDLFPSGAPTTKDWTYQQAYTIAGLYNGNPGCQATPGSGDAVDADTGWTYCKFAIESFDQSFRCDGDPTWGPVPDGYER